MFKLRHFAVQEFVPKAVYDERGEKSIYLMDERILVAADQLRETFGQAVINNWMFGGILQYSGLRTVHSKDYSPWSQHAYGRAIDIKFAKHSAEEIREYIFRNERKFPTIVGVELGVPWLHVDCRINTTDQRFITFNA